MDEINLDTFRKNVGLIAEANKFKPTILCQAFRGVLNHELRKLTMKGGAGTLDYIQGFSHAQHIFDQCFEPPKPAYVEIKSDYGAPESTVRKPKTKRERTT